MENESYRKSSFVYFFKVNKEIGALYHSLNMQIVYGSKRYLAKIEQLDRKFRIEDLKFNVSEKTALQRLIKEKFIIKENFDEQEFERLRKRSVNPSGLISLYIILTENCNFRCRYCAFFAHLPNDYHSQFMTETTADSALNLFLTNCIKDTEVKKSIVLYGGEPLLNIPVFRHIVERVRSKTFEEKSGGNVEIVTFTNGYLVTPDLAKFCAEKKVIPIVSIDGTKQVHNLMRIDFNKKDTFDKVLAGYRLFKEYGCNVGISAIIASHNIDKLPAIISYFKKEFQPINIGLNPLHLMPGEKNNSWEISLEKSAKGMLKAFIQSRQDGIYIEQIMRRIRPFILRTPRVKDCPSCGGLIRFYPSGKFGPCGHFVSMGKNCLSMADGKNWNTSDIKEKWNSRTSLNMGISCKYCPQVSICGGGCPLTAFKTYNDLMARDDRACIQSKIILDWLIKDLYRIVKPKITHKTFIYVPSGCERKKILGNIRINNHKLPLQNYSKYGEMNIEVNNLS